MNRKVADVSNVKAHVDQETCERTEQKEDDVGNNEADKVAELGAKVHPQVSPGEWVMASNEIKVQKVILKCAAAALPFWLFLQEQGLAKDLPEYRWKG